MRTRAALIAAIALAACTRQRPPGEGLAPGSATPTPTPTPTPAPASFTAEYRQVSKQPTCLSNRRIKIDARGDVFAAVNQAECARGQAWSTPYPAQPTRTLTDAERAQLAGVIRHSGFWALSSQAAEVDDGTIEELDVALDGATHSVRMDNATAPAFQQVRQALLDFEGNLAARIFTDVG